MSDRTLAHKCCCVTPRCLCHPFQTTMRVGSLQAGFLADRVGAPLALGMGAAAALVYGIFVAIRYPQVRHLH